MGGSAHPFRSGKRYWTKTLCQACMEEGGDGGYLQKREKKKAAYPPAKRYLKKKGLVRGIWVRGVGLY